MHAEDSDFAQFASELCRVGQKLDELPVVLKQALRQEFREVLDLQEVAERLSIPSPPSPGRPRSPGSPASPNGRAMAWHEQDMQRSKLPNAGKDSAGTVQQQSLLSPLQAWSSDVVRQTSPKEATSPIENSDASSNEEESAASRRQSVASSVLPMRQLRRNSNVHAGQNHLRQGSKQSVSSNMMKANSLNVPQGFLPQSSAADTDASPHGVVPVPIREDSQEAQEAQEESAKGSSSRKLHGRITERTEGRLSMVSSFVDYPSKEKLPSCCQNIQHYAERMVNSTSFDYISGSLVMLNAITIGMQTDYLAQNLTDLPTHAYRIADSLFCFVFTLELVLRIVAYGTNMFRESSWKWNLFDCVLVGLQLSDEIMSHVATESSGLNFSFMRVLRILRLIRVLRIIRILRLIGELRAIVSSIMGSLRSLGWTVVLMFMLVYVFGIYFTQLVLDHRLTLKQEGEHLPDDHAMVRYFGSLAQSILSLYQAITTGLAWSELSTPLIDDISVWLGLVMAFFVAFAMLALMNVVTGVFVEAALKSAKDDHDEFMICHVRELFLGQEEIDWAMFQAQLENTHMQAFFASIDVDISEAEAVFRLLDADGSGEIDLDEFLNGCLNLKGPAKAIDTCSLLHQTRTLEQKLECMQFTMDALYGCVTALPQSLSGDSLDDNDRSNRSTSKAGPRMSCTSQMSTVIGRSRSKVQELLKKQGHANS